MRQNIHELPRSTISSTICHKMHEYRERITDRKIWFGSSLQHLFETFSILMTCEGDMIKYIYCTSCEVSVILVHFSWKFKFLTDVRKILKNIKFHDNPSSGRWVVLSRRTDMKRIAASRNSTNAPKSGQLMKSVKKATKQQPTHANKRKTIIIIYFSCFCTKIVQWQKSIPLIHILTL
jgi:hypothetical protein